MNGTAPNHRAPDVGHSPDTCPYCIRTAWVATHDVCLLSPEIRRRRYPESVTVGAIGGTRCLARVSESVCWNELGHDGPCAPVMRTEEQRRVTS